jgi:hypothetical protein
VPFIHYCYNLIQGSESVIFKDFELLFNDEEIFLKRIIEELQENNERYFDFTKSKLNSIGLQLETLYSLYNKKYIAGSLFDNNTRGIVWLTHKGKFYFEHKSQYLALNKVNNRKQNLKYWIPIIISNLISIFALIVSIFKE